MKLLNNYKNMHTGQKILVCGLGPSLQQNIKPINKSNILKFGVNDIERYIKVDYNIVVNKEMTFAKERWNWIKNSIVPTFTHLNIDTYNPNIVKIMLGIQGQARVGNERVDYSNNSPFMAILIAAYMGCTKIGYIGVDFTTAHVLSNKKEEIHRDFTHLKIELNKKGIDLYNFSNRSIMRKTTKTLEEFLI